MLVCSMTTRRRNLEFAVQRSWIETGVFSPGVGSNYTRLKFIFHFRCSSREGEERKKRRDILLIISPNITEIRGI